MPIRNLNDVLNLHSLFTVWDTYFNSNTKDLYFVGIKKGTLTFDKLEKYIDYLKNAKVTSFDITNAKKYLIGHVTHGLIFNDTFIPDKLSHIDDIINEDTRKNPLI